MSKAYKISRRRLISSGFSTATLAALPSCFIAGAKMQKIQGDKMTRLIPYLLFDGKCREAMEFYKSVFGGELILTKVKDSPARDQMQAFQQEKVLNAHLQSGGLEISASDWLAPNETPIRGNTVCLFLSGGTFQNLKAVFDRLSQGAEVTNPLKEVFFGVYGDLNDRFGVRWMFQTNKKD
jgi:PhnB protein